MKSTVLAERDLQSIPTRLVFSANQLEFHAWFGIFATGHHLPRRIYQIKPIKMINRTTKAETLFGALSIRTGYRSIIFPLSARS